MQTKHKNTFTTIHTEGAILPPDLLQKVLDNDKNLPGLNSEDYHLGKNEKLNEAINRSWNRLLGVWSGFRTAAEKLAEGDTGATITREKWLLILFQELGYGRLSLARGLEIEGKSYPISHIWENTPIHLVGCRIDLDRRTTGVAGASRMSPHSMVQEFLNRSKEYLWAFVSNGLTLRILRDNVSLTRQAYVEFDLNSMMNGEVYSDFALLWLLCHQSRVEGEKPEECYLEKWSRNAYEQGTRALEQLRAGVEEAITVLGKGFLKYKGNRSLREKLKAGEILTQDYYRQLLRLVYRLLFLFVAEDRDLLLLPDASESAKEIYTKYYSTTRLRNLAGKRRGTKHSDFYQGLKVIMDKLSYKGCSEIALPALGSYLWSEGALQDIYTCDISNSDFLDAIRTLSYTVDKNTKRSVDYKNLGSEELGSVYESLLELHPVINADTGEFTLKTAGGSERKTTGSYYTPSSLISCLLDSALDPVLQEARKKPNPESEILSLKICDPACGSGHFLIAATHRVARRLASVRTGDDEPAPEAVKSAIRDVISNCIYGVDLNPMAVELCKVNLWMESLEPGKPLSFLDHRIKCGNSLIGIDTMERLQEGIPDDAFKPVTGDDKTVASRIKALNKRQRKELQSGQMLMMMDEREGFKESFGHIAGEMKHVNTIQENSTEDVKRKEAYYGKIRSGVEWWNSWTAANIWTSAFFYQLKDENDPAIATHERLMKFMEKPSAVDGRLVGTANAMAIRNDFFHWPLEFPVVYESGGFDVILGNPPWEKITTLEREFFATIPEIVDEKRSDRRKELINSLQSLDPTLYTHWLEQKRFDETCMHFLRESGRYPLSAVGELNLYPLFVELSYHLINKRGRAGIIIKTGMILSPTWAEFSSYLLDNNGIQSALDFRNWRGWFPAIGYHERFTLLTIKADNKSEDLILGYYLDDPSELKTSDKIFTITRNESTLLNPISKTVPTFESKYHKDCVIEIYKQFPILGDKSSEWGVRYTRGLDMSTEADKLRDLEELTSQGCKPDIFLRMKKDDVCYIPLYEGKLIHQFEHRFASFEGIPRNKRFGIKAGTYTPTEKQKSDSEYHITPRYWISLHDVMSDIKTRKLKGSWVISYRDTTNVMSNFRTSIGCICDGTCNYTAPNIVLDGMPEHQRALSSLFFLTLMNSVPFDYVVRQKFFGAHFLKSILIQIAAPPMSSILEHSDFLLPRALELTYTSLQLTDFAQACGYNGEPFIWNEARRFLIRSELDAFYFHIYKISPERINSILESFAILKDKDIGKYGEYRTKRVILDIYDAMSEVIKSGKPYKTILDPPPADPRVAHTSKE